MKNTCAYTGKCVRSTIVKYIQLHLTMKHSSEHSLNKFNKDHKELRFCS